MACCQERFVIFFLIFIICLIDISQQKGYAPVFKDFTTPVFQRHLKVSRHHPVCVLFRKAGGVGSRLEKTVYDLWSDKRTPSNYTTWEFGSFDIQKDKLPPKTVSPAKLPSVRCYLGESSAYSYVGKAKKDGVDTWLKDLASLHIEHSQEVTPELLESLQKQFKILLIAFPDGPRHHEVEDMVYELASEVESCKALAVHLNSPYVKSLRDRFRFSKYPSVIVVYNKVIKRKGTKQIVEDHRVFSNVEVKKHVLQVYIAARSLLAPMLSMEDIDSYHKNASQAKQFRPLLVCFYAYWGRDVNGYLDALNSTLLQYKMDKVKMRYGLVDLTSLDTKQMMSEYIKSRAMQRVPFLMLYYMDDRGELTNMYIHSGRPWPWIMYDSINGIHQNIVTKAGVKQYTPPWGTVTFDQFSSLLEGPNGSLCTPWSSNLTDNNPPPPKPVVKKIFKVVVNRPSSVKPKVKLTRHEIFDTDSIERQLTSHDGIPLLTQDTWSKVVEKSHAPRHIFYKVIFIMANCGNCKRNNQTFKDIQKAVSHIDGGAMYYVNCTAERALCSAHNIRGYPIIAAYRGLGWMDNAPCLSNNSKSGFRKFVRLDYHGAIMYNSIMDWFSSVAGNAVNNLKTNPVPVSFGLKNVRILATVIPIQNNNSTHPSYGYKCLRLLCERLYSLMDCYTQYSGSVAEVEYESPDLDLAVSKYSGSVAEVEYESPDLELAVSKIEFERRDDIGIVLMRYGQSLHDTLEDMTDTIHALHDSHSYGIKTDQTCEENPVACTDILTEFIIDHSKLPITPITSDLFHTASSSLKENDLPILVALVHTANITAPATFIQNLTKVAYEVYSSMTVMTLNVDKYSIWATKFVPKLYGHKRVWKSDDLDPQLMYVYPRLCIVKKSDHKHAAFYPPLDRKKRRMDDFYTENMMKFVKRYLASPKDVLIETEEF